MTDGAYTGVRCDRCLEPMDRADYIALNGECGTCNDAHLNSYETDGLGMGEWHAEIPET